MLADPVPVVGLELLSAGGVVAKIPVNQWRSDVAADYPGSVGAERSGFHAWVDLTAPQATLLLQLVALLADDTRVRLAHIRTHPIRAPAIALLPGVVSTLQAPVAPETPATDAAASSARPGRDPVPRQHPAPGGVLPRCSVVVPVHNYAALTRQCLDILLARHPDDPWFEIVVVDDASTDETAALLAGYGNVIRTVPLAQNAGFAGACNAGAAAAQGEHLVFLNNDTVPQPAWLTALVRHADINHRAAVVGAKLLYSDATIQHAGIVFGPDRYPHHLYAGFPADHPAVNTSRAFRAVTGACCLIRRAPFMAAGGFDRAYVNGWEDVDLCLRLGERGYAVHYCHESVVYHLESASRNVRADRERRNRHLYATRWLHQIEPDSFRYYLDDGLLWTSVRGPLYPIRIETSPLLAIVGRGNQEAAKVLNERADQVATLRRSNILLHRQLTELRAQLAAGGPGRPDAPAEPPAPHQTIESRIIWPEEGLTYRVVSIALLLEGHGGAIQEVLPRLLGQRRGHGLELVAIVADPTDDRVATLREAGAGLVAVPPGMSTGARRNLAAAYAKGVAVVFLDPGVIPADDAWLANLLGPFDIDLATAVTIAAVTVGEDQAGITADMVHAAERIVLAHDGRATPAIDERARRRLLDFHGVSMAVRTDVVAEIPFPEGGTADDDWRWAAEVVAAGYAILRELTASVRQPLPR